MRGLLSTAALFAIAALIAPAAAQIVTDGSVGSAAEIPGPIHRIPASLGQIRGQTLLHSFESFSVPTGAAALFTGPGGLSAVVSRVTGGEPSAIDGIVASTVPNADLFFVNPAGIVFGPNASINVPAGAHFSTADTLIFADGSSLQTDAATGSTLAIAPPAAFGFSGANGNLIVAGADLIARGSLSLTAANVAIGDGANVVSYGPRLALAGFGAGGKFDLAALRADAPVDGAVALVGANVFTDLLVRNANDLSNPRGDISIDAGSFRMAEGAILVTSGSLFRGTGPSGRIDIVASGAMVVESPLTGAANLLSTQLATIGRSGDVSIAARSLAVANANIDTANYADGDGGNLTLRVADRLSLFRDAFIRSAAFKGSAGAIDISAGSMSLSPGGAIASISAGSGHGRDVKVAVRGLLQIDGGEEGFASDTQIGAQTTPGSSGHGGNIFVSAGALTLKGGGILSTAGFGGAPGSVFVDVSGDVLISGGRARNSGIYTNLEPGSLGTSGGGIRLVANRLMMDDGGVMLADTFSSGEAGDIVIGVRTATLTNGARIFASTQGSGNAGDLTFTALESLAIDRGAGLTTTAFENSTGGKAGNLTVNAKSIALTNSGYISSETYGPGDAGIVDVTADTLTIKGIVDNSSSGIFGTAESGASGRGGIVRIHARELTVADDAQIAAYGVDSPGGSIAIGDALSPVQKLTVSGARILSDSVNRAPAGSVTIYADDLSIASTATSQYGAFIGSSNRVDGAAGDVVIFAGDLRLGPGGQIASDSLRGAAGLIRINASRSLRMTGSGSSLFGDINITKITTTSGAAQGGRIAITSDGPIVSDNAAILALGQTDGALISIQAPYFIRSTDVENLVEVTGTLAFDAQVGDVTQGSDQPADAFVDASQVLRGRCIPAAVAGRVSSLNIEAIGPRALAPVTGGTGGSCHR